MKHLIVAWIEGCRVPLYVSLTFGFLASLLYFVAGLTLGGGRLGAMYVLYYVSWPASWVASQITARLEDRIPDRLFEFCLVAGVIVAGMLWFFLIALLIKSLANRFRLRFLNKQPTEGNTHPVKNSSSRA